MSENILRIQNVEKYYGSRNNLTKAIDDISFDVNKGEFVAIMGASGSGKTTLLNCISTIDKVTSGNIYVDGNNITQLKGSALNRFRRDKLGFIFQDFNLIDTLTIHENIALALTINKTNKNEIDGKVNSVAKELGIEEILTKYPYEVSGGQKQRTACARALITNPKLILADEPTGNLDSKTSDEVMSLLKTMIKKYNQTLVMITHDETIAQMADRVIYIEDGKVVKGGVTND